MNLSKEHFVEYMKKFQDDCETNDRECDRVNGIFEIDWICDVTGRHHALVISLIEKLFCFENDWIGWFCFENNFGREGLECSEKDGPNIPIKNASDLWDFVKG